MENFTYLDLVKAVAARTSLTQAQAAEAVQATLDVIASEALGGKRVKLGNFGSFELGTHAYSSIVSSDGVRRSGRARVIRFITTGLLKEVLRGGGTEVTTLRRRTAEQVPTEL